MIILLLPLGCGPYADPIAPDGNPKCGTQELGKLTALYASELDTACRPLGKLEDCKGSERDKVDAKYEKLFKEWAECE